MLDESPTSTNLGNDHEFIKKNTRCILEKLKANSRELMFKVDNIIPLCPFRVGPTN